MSQTQNLSIMEDRDTAESHKAFIKQTKGLIGKIKLIYYIKHIDEISPFRLLNLAKYHLRYTEEGRRLYAELEGSLKRDRIKGFYPLLRECVCKQYELGFISDMQKIAFNFIWLLGLEMSKKYYLIYKFL